MHLSSGAVLAEQGSVWRSEIFGVRRSTAYSLTCETVPLSVKPLVLKARMTSLLLKLGFRVRNKSGHPLTCTPGTQRFHKTEKIFAGGLFF